MATLALRREKRHLKYVPCPGVRALMLCNDWPLLRAWREWHGHSRQAMAKQLGMAMPTYALLDNGTIPLCRWITAGLEAALLQCEQTSPVALQSRKRNKAPMESALTVPSKRSRGQQP